MDVLPAIGPEKCGLDCARLRLVDRAAARCREVASVGFGLGLQDAVHRGDQLNELVDSGIALLRRYSGVVANPLEFVQDRVLTFLFPVKKEHVLEQLGELGIGVDALTIVELGEQLDIQRQCQHRPGTFSKYSMCDGVVIEVKPIASGKNVTDHSVDWS